MLKYEYLPAALCNKLSFLTKFITRQVSSSTGLRYAVADLEEDPGGPSPPLILGKKEEMTEGKKASRASKSRPPPPPPPLLSSRSGSSTGTSPKDETYYILNFYSKNYTPTP